MKNSKKQVVLLLVLFFLVACEHYEKITPKFSKNQIDVINEIKNLCDFNEVLWETSSSGTNPDKIEFIIHLKKIDNENCASLNERKIGLTALKIMLGAIANDTIYTDFSVNLIDEKTPGIINRIDERNYNYNKDEIFN